VSQATGRETQPAASPTPPGRHARAAAVAAAAACCCRRGRGWPRRARVCGGARHRWLLRQARYLLAGSGRGTREQVLEPRGAPVARRPTAPALTPAPCCPGCACTPPPATRRRPGVTRLEAGQGLPRPQPAQPEGRSPQGTAPRRRALIAHTSPGGPPVDLPVVGVALQELSLDERLNALLDDRGVGHKARRQLARHLGWGVGAGSAWGRAAARGNGGLGGCRRGGQRGALSAATASRAAHQVGPAMPIQAQAPWARGTPQKGVRACARRTSVMIALWSSTLRAFISRTMAASICGLRSSST
jgi:hypothetical protein